MALFLAYDFEALKVVAIWLNKNKSGPIGSDLLFEIFIVAF